MTSFFVQTDRCISGPFTGVELREAALAGIIGPDAVVGGSQHGPWFRVTDVGLFSDKKTPLPHPPGTHIPHYQVRGMSSAFQGPFKLRELIGFAARGMLPADALVQSDCSDDWVRARRYAVIAACLNGELVLTDGTGKVVLRSSVLAKNSTPEGSLQGARAPIELAKTVDASEVAKVPPPPPISQTHAEGVAIPKPIRIDAAEPESTRPPSKLAQLWSSRVEPIREVLSGSLGRLARPRVAMRLVCLVLVFAGVASAFSFWKQMSMRRDEAIGDWVCMSSDYGELSFGISLRKDGRCVVFNMQGASWSGDFDWVQRNDDSKGFQQIAPFSTVFDQLGPKHQAGPIKPTDGYIQLSGFVKEPPMIDGHPARDLFLRREGDQLRLGYLTSVDWTEDTKSMQAGWMTATKLQNKRPDVGGKLQTIELELPVPTADFGGQQPMHISKAIDAVQEGVPASKGTAQSFVHGTLTYSNKVNAAYLLKHFGLPDEARPLFPFEVPEIRNGPSFEGAQLVRYGDLKFFLSNDGQLRYLALVTQRIF
jgi:hypothetical protein